MHRYRIIRFDGLAELVCRSLVKSASHGGSPVELSLHLILRVVPCSLVVECVKALFKLRETLVEGRLLLFEALNDVSQVLVLDSGLLGRHSYLTSLTESHVGRSRQLIPSRELRRPPVCLLLRELERWHYRCLGGWRPLLRCESILGRQVYHRVPPCMRAARWCHYVFFA